MNLIQSFLTLDRGETLTIAVVGDTLLDEYYSVKCTRISPEFPIPVLLSPTASPSAVVPGGAANVLRQLSPWKARAVLVSHLERDLTLSGVDTRYCCSPPGWVTPRKRRFYHGDFPLMRWDVEQPNQGGKELLLDQLRTVLRVEKPSVVILSDYGKGVFADQQFSVQVLQECRGVTTVVDPKSLWDWSGCTVLKPNQGWLQDYRERFGGDPRVSGMVVTDAGDGISVDGVRHLAADICSQRPVIRSVIGAGDCYTAFLAMGSRRLQDLEQAAKLAFLAATEYITDKHNKPVTPERLIQRYGFTPR